MMSSFKVDAYTSKYEVDDDDVHHIMQTSTVTKKKKTKKRKNSKNNKKKIQNSFGNLLPTLANEL